VVSPFEWNQNILPKHPIPVDAIPNTGANQQIVFTDWAGRSPQDIDDQITYPLTTYLLGLPAVQSVRSNSMFGFSSIYIIFEDDIEFYWSRSRILEKLSAIPKELLPEGVKPTLGPDATALGQVFWYTIEPRDENNNPTGGWSLDDIRSVQDYYVKYGLSSAQGISEVASIGGYVKSYQVDVNPDALKTYEISLMQVAKAIKESNRDVGAKTIEINQVEYIVRGLGYIESLEDFEQIAVAESENVPIYLKDVAKIKIGPQQRRGVLDKAGAEVVGGVVIARDGYNPMQAINNVKVKIKEISPGLPQKTLADGTKSQLKIIPFYDRSTLIKETIGTLNQAISLQLIIAVLVVIIIVFNIRSSLVISAVLPIAVLLVFIAMKIFNVQANIVALSGIAIAIGTMIDLAVILSENVLKKLESSPEDSLFNNIYEGSAEVSSAILTAVLTTVISFTPVFALEAAEGKLFIPLAYTKTFALLAAFLVTVLILPTLMYMVFKIKINKNKTAYFLNGLMIILGIVMLFYNYWVGIFMILYGISCLLSIQNISKPYPIKNLHNYVLIIGVLVLLSKLWLPLGYQQSLLSNIAFVGVLVSLLIGFYLTLQKYYERILRFFLNHIKAFLILPLFSILLGLLIWQGFASVFYWPKKAFHIVDVKIEDSGLWKNMSSVFPGIGKEFMPSLDEGSFILMPTSMTHSSLSFNKEKLQQMDMLVYQIPEVESVVGKLGRVESAIDPAPISMFENLITYKTEYILDDNEEPIAFKVNENGYFRIDGLIINNNKIEAVEKSAEDIWFNSENFLFVDKTGQAHSESIQDKLFYEIDKKFEAYLVEDEQGEFFRNWRNQIQSPDDIWEAIAKATKIPGITSAPKLQPIETRQVMLQTGMRAPMGIKVSGPDLRTIEDFGKELEDILKQVSNIKTSAVFADRVVAKPYLQLKLKRQQLARYGLKIDDVQNYITTAIGGQALTQTVEGRERYDVSLRYPRELRDSPEAIKSMLISSGSCAQIPLGELVEINYKPGPQMIKRENTFLNSYVLFDRAEGVAEVTAVESAKNAIEAKINAGELEVPKGVSYRFAGSFENQVRSEKRLSLIIPVVMVVIFLILYFQFKSVRISSMVFSSIALAFSGGFIMIWLYGQDWFLNLSWFGENLRDIFQLENINLSVAVWVGFIALFGIATDDAVLMATYLKQAFKQNPTKTKEELREAVIEGGLKRIRPAVMTSVTTVIALLPVLSSTGKGSDIMVPMAIPAFGGMLMASLTYFLLPILFYVVFQKQFQSTSKIEP
jgi:Cu(I)/Ag(I) efflux system membrane protein CusA/SilA